MRALVADSANNTNEEGTFRVNARLIFAATLACRRDERQFRDPELRIDPDKSTA
jgi:hypothetical protein